MADNINQIVQDCNVLLLAAKTHQPELAEYGVTTEEVQTFGTAIQTLETKDMAHKEAMNAYHNKTTLQKAKIAEAAKEIWKVREIAKGVFKPDKAKMKEFNIGSALPVAVAEILNELLYIKEVATRYKTELSARGLKDEDLTALQTIHDELAAADSDQENSLSLQTAAGVEKKTVLKETKLMAYRIRQSAAVCFADNPEVLKEFKSIIKRKKSASSTDTGTAADTPADSTEPAT